MRALVARHQGAPDEVLDLIDDVEVPEAGVGEVVIAVEACALNFADGLICRGTYQRSPVPPFTPGLEVSGSVVQSGPDATHAVGDHVTGLASLPHGGLAEFCTARSVDVFPTDPSLTPITAAAGHITYQTAWFALVRLARLRPGETLLVNAGAGGVGSAAVQLGRALGATVIATAGGPHKVHTCVELGATLALDHSRDDIAQAVRLATHGRGVDVVFDPVGGASFDRATHLIAWEGRILVIGAASGMYAELATNHAMVKNYSVIGLNWGSYPEHRPDLVQQANTELTTLRHAHLLEPLVFEVVGLNRAVEALVRLTSGATTGKIVVTPSLTAAPRP